MKQGKLITTVALAGLLGLSSGVTGQTTAIPAAPDPAKGGQASTKTPAGVANPTQRPDGSNPASRADVKSEARLENRSPANTTVPKGEPSTMTNNQPNAPQPTGELSRAEVKPTKNELKPQAGVKGERPDVPTNPKDKTGTPQ
ncbi:serine/threonine protein kinase [Variovorax sp. J22P271]|uniref:serine/threonine protein kinase n=1 Tax=Variovorax davisae TaxID=3053515 RepID=UPI002576619C|nr:serine/threonine protein kinase [Variovorax sp. J22P271]MDM0035717.1 serine/threonine protein kinase [Variovorax sp. J22P271]